MNVLKEIAFSGNTHNTSLEFVGDYEEFVIPRCIVIDNAEKLVEQVSERLKTSEPKSLTILPKKGSAQEYDKETADVLELVNKYVQEKDLKDVNLGKSRVKLTDFEIDFTAHNKDLAA